MGLLGGQWECYFLCYAAAPHLMAVYFRTFYVRTFVVAPTLLLMFVGVGVTSDFELQFLRKLSSQHQFLCFFLKGCVWFLKNVVCRILRSYEILDCTFFVCKDSAWVLQMYGKVRLLATL